MKLSALFAALGLALSVAACGGADAAPSSDPAAAGAASAATASASSVALTGTVIEVQMITDGEGNYFEPNHIEAKPGDVVRFVLQSGVHNVSFPSDKNAHASALPGPSDYLQLPGQTHDVVVDFPEGEYHFQCDPHVAVGMVGTLKVDD